MDIYCSTAKLPQEPDSLWKSYWGEMSGNFSKPCFLGLLDRIAFTELIICRILLTGLLKLWQMIILCGIVFLSEALCQLFWIIFQWENCCRCFSASLLPLDHSRVLFVKLYNFKELFSSPSYHFPRVRVCDTSGWRRQGFPSVLL